MKENYNLVAIPLYCSISSPVLSRVRFGCVRDIIRSTQLLYMHVSACVCVCAGTYMHALHSLTSSWRIAYVLDQMRKERENEKQAKKLPMQTYVHSRCSLFLCSFFALIFFACCSHNRFNKYLSLACLVQRTDTLHCTAAANTVVLFQTEYTQKFSFYV